MDALDRVRDAGTHLFDRVDAALLTLGAAPAHPVWALTRRLAVTPATAVRDVATLDAGELRRAADAVHRAEAERHARLDALPTRLAGAGTAARAYETTWRAMSESFGGHPDPLADTATHLDELADWVEAVRADVAVAVARCLGSREAVLIRRAVGAPDPEAIQAAADLGAYVLRTVATGLDEGWAVHQKWSGRLAEIRYVPPTPDTVHDGWIDVR
jgi:hypothetical protein